MSLVDLYLNKHALVVGVEDDPDGGVRIYLYARYRGIYCIVEDVADCEHAKALWATGSGHITMPPPPAEFIFQDDAGRAWDQRADEKVCERGAGTL